MESSGVENRCNGRIIQRGLFRRIWNGRVHPSRNHFLAQVELWTQEGSPLPATKTNKAGFRDGAPRLEALFAWIPPNGALTEWSNRNDQRKEGPVMAHALERTPHGVLDAVGMEM